MNDCVAPPSAGGPRRPPGLGQFAVGADPVRLRCRVGVLARMSGWGRGAIAHRPKQHLASRHPRRPSPATAPVARSARPPALHQRQQRRRLRGGPARTRDGAGRVCGAAESCGARPACGPGRPAVEPVRRGDGSAVAPSNRAAHYLFPLRGSSFGSTYLIDHGPVPWN